MRKTSTIERLFGADPEQVYTAYWDLSLWPAILPNILEAQVNYDDGIHQEFTMLVEKEGVRESVRGARIGIPHQKIEICHFVVAPGFRIMRGEWRFEPVMTGHRKRTKVTAERVFALDSPARESFVSSHLESLLAANLEAFDWYLSPEPSKCAISV